MIPVPAPDIPAPAGDPRPVALLKGLLWLIGSVLPAVLLGVVLVVVTADVFVRTVLHRSFPMAHDLAIVAFSGVVWLGITGTALAGQLFGVQFFVDRLPARLHMPMRVASHLVVILIAISVIQAAIAQVQTARFTRFVSLGWPKWIVSAALAAAMAAVILVQLIQLYELTRRRRAG
jgi:TRAP-type C4-dicarboxylate transport system permease small subunit